MLILSSEDEDRWDRHAFVDSELCCLGKSDATPSFYPWPLDHGNKTPPKCLGDAFYLAVWEGASSLDHSTSSHRVELSSRPQSQVDEIHPEDQLTRCFFSRLLLFPQAWRQDKMSTRISQVLYT